MVQERLLPLAGPFLDPFEHLTTFGAARALANHVLAGWGVGWSCSSAVRVSLPALIWMV